MHVTEVVLELFELRRCLQNDVRAASIDFDGECFASTDADDALHVGETIDFLAVNGRHQVTRLEAGGFGSTRRLHGVDASTGGLLAVKHKNAGENRDCQNEIRDWTCCDHGGARTDPLVHETHRFLGFGHLRHGLPVGHARGILVAEEFHVAAEGYCRDLPACAVAVEEAKDLWAKTDRESEDFYTAAAGHQEMAKLMKEDNNRQDENEGNDVAGEVPTKCPQGPHNIHTCTLVRRYGVSKVTESLLG